MSIHLTFCTFQDVWYRQGVWGVGRVNTMWHSQYPKEGTLCLKITQLKRVKLQSQSFCSQVITENQKFVSFGYMTEYVCDCFETL